jgi:hypothetical protein
MIPAEFIRIAVGHFLALGHQTGSMPPFGLLQFLKPWAFLRCSLSS